MRIGDAYERAFIHIDTNFGYKRAFICIDTSAAYLCPYAVLRSFVRRKYIAGYWQLESIYDHFFCFKSTCGDTFNFYYFPKYLIGQTIHI